ncbi:MAG: Gfo/Idh/MocA family protein [Paracoccaceae bacterium]
MLNAAIIGLGWWGKTLVRAAKAGGEIAIVAGATGRRALAEDFAAAEGFDLKNNLDEILADPKVDAVILATPHLDHEGQMIAAAKAGKHIFVEKPFTLSKTSAEAAVAAIRAAGITVSIGHNRRFHPHMADLRRRVRKGALGTILHVEGTMTAPNGLFLKPDSWRVDPRQSPAGGMAGLGIHMVDSMVDLFGPIAHVTCQSLHRATPSGAQDTTSVLLGFVEGMTGYVSCMTATSPTYRFCVYGSGGVAEIRGQGLDDFSFAPAPDAPLSGHATAKPVERHSLPGFDTVAAELSAFAAAVSGASPYPITPDEMIHGAAVFEAIAASATSQARVQVSQ